MHIKYLQIEWENVTRNKPMVNDRIPYVYIETKDVKGKKTLQGDKVEHPDYIRENKIVPDYYFYITNQIMKPVGQIYSLIADKLVKEDYHKKLEFLKTKYDEHKALEKLNDQKFKDVCDLIFGEILRKAKIKKEKKREITSFSTKKSKVIITSTTEILIIICKVLIPLLLVLLLLFFMIMTMFSVMFIMMSRIIVNFLMAYGKGGGLSKCLLGYR